MPSITYLATCWNVQVGAECPRFFSFNWKICEKVRVKRTETKECYDLFWMTTNAIIQHQVHKKLNSALVLLFCLIIMSRNEAILVPKLDDQ
jgi:hypothetical protein